jgi:hypothetical protein
MTKGDRVTIKIPKDEMRFYGSADGVIPHGEHFGFNGKSGVVLGSNTFTFSWVKLDCLQRTKTDDAEQKQDWKKCKKRYISCPNKYLYPETK